MNSPQILRGLNGFTREPIELRFNKVITNVDPLVSRHNGPLPLIAPGFIDVHINGYAGADYCDPKTTLAAIDHSLNVQFGCGVTRLLATIITNAPDELTGALHNLANAKEQLPHGHAIEGFHVEGPFISPEDGPRGAHPLRWVRPPSIEEYRRWQDAARGYIRLITLSPEWPEAIPFIETIVREGVVAAIGHTKATTEQIDAAVKAGATKSTHLGNGAHGMIRRHPNYIWDQMANDSLAAGFITDGIHLPWSFLKCAIRAKGIERSIIVTDAVGPAECTPGFYTLGEVEVELKPEGRVVMKGGERLAGSALRMDVGVGNTIRHAGVSLAEALVMATRNPARVMRIANRLRGLEPGEKADFIEFAFDEATKNITVQRTWLSGELVYERN